MGDALARLRAVGDRVTVGKRAILEVLLERSAHLTADEVYGRTGERVHGMHKSTVYRTLESFVALGLVTQVSVGHGAAVYHLSDDFTGHRHAHGRCRSCGIVVDLPGDLLDAVGDRTEREHGFILDRDNVALMGLCADCRSSRVP